MRGVKRNVVHHLQLLEPTKQRLALGDTPSEALKHVMVGVDKAWHHHTPSHVNHHIRVGVGRRILHGAQRFDGTPEPQRVSSDQMGKC